MTIQKLPMKFIKYDYIIYKIVMLSHFSFSLIIFNHMTNYNSQKLAKIALWQHFMESVVCFHPWLGSIKGCQGFVRSIKV